MNNRLVLIFSALALALFAAPEAKAQWVPTNGPYHGFVHALAAIGTNTPSPTLFAGMSDGVYLSTDNGASWKPANNGLTNAGITAFAVTGANSPAPTLFAGINGGGIYRSRNNGISWSADNSGVTDFGILSFATSGANTQTPILFAGSQRGRVYISTDKGGNWTVADTALPHGVNVIASDDRPYTADNSTSTNVANASSPVIFAGTGGMGNGGGVFLSTNNGTNWTVSNNGIEEGAITSLGVIGTNGTSPMVFAGTLEGAFLSTDNGATWNIANKGLKKGTEIRAFAASATNIASPTIFVGTSDGVFLSTDNGISWKEANEGMRPGIQIYALIVIGTNLFAATNDGVWRRPL